jgi:hypothetical protein
MPESATQPGRNPLQGQLYCRSEMSRVADCGEIGDDTYQPALNKLIIGGWLMTRKEHLRRVMILCRHCLRNLAFYKAGWRGPSLIRKGHFWSNLNCNFLDICILEWCKLFGDPRGKNCWQKVISDCPGFQAGLLSELGISEAEFKVYIFDTKKYRDKFVAHLDLEPTMDIPRLDLAMISASYLYDYIHAHENEGDYFPDMLKDSTKLFEGFSKMASAEYEQEE